MTILASYVLTSGSQAVDIPSGTQVVAFLWSYYDAGSGNGVATATLDSETYDSLAELASDGTNLTGGYALWTSPNIGNGLTFAHTFDAAPSNGPTRFLVCMGGLSTTALRDTTTIIARAGAGTNAAVTVDTASGDEIVVLDSCFDTASPALGTGYTNLQTQANVLNISARLKWITGSGASLTVNSETDEYPLVVALVFQPSTGTVEQEGFAFGDDDGSESGHTLGTQDSNVTAPLAQNVLLRLLLNATLDPSALAYTLRYQKNGSGGYVPVPVGSGSAEAFAQPTWGAVGTAASGTTSCTPAYPTGISASTSKLLCVVTGRSNTASTAFTMPAGWTSLGQLEDGTGTWGVDTGTRRVAFFIKDTVDGTETGTVTVSLSGTTANTLRASIFRIEVPSGYNLQTQFASGADTTNGTAYSATSSTNVDLDSDRLLLVATAQNIDTGTNSSVAQSATGITFGTLTNRANTAVTNGNDHRHLLWSRPISSGSGNVAVTHSYTISANGSGPTAFLVLRAQLPAVVNEVYISPSSNITAGGEATTARLAAPSGKSTSDFVTGRRWDDENGTDTIDLTTDDYTEVEWCLQAQSPATNGDYYDFRVYAGSSALDTYTVTPRWTIGSGGGSPYSITAESGSYSLTGYDAGTLFSRVVVAEFGTYTLTGIEALADYSMVAENGTYNLTGNDAALVVPGSTLTAEYGTYTLTGQDAGLLNNKTVVAEQGLYTLTGQDAGVLNNKTVVAEQGSYALSGQDTQFTRSQGMVAEFGTYSLNGQDSNLLFNKSVVAGVGTYNLNGQDAALGKSRILLAEYGTYNLTGETALIDLWMSCAAGTYNLTGQDTTFSTSTTNTLVAEYGTYNLTGTEVLVDFSMAAESGTYTLTGQDVPFSENRAVTAEQGSYSLSGQDSNFNKTNVLACVHGIYNLNGMPVTFNGLGGDGEFKLSAPWIDGLSFEDGVVAGENLSGKE